MREILLVTKRLHIRLASNDDMRTLIAQQTDEELIKAYSEMLDLSIAHPELRQWYAAWFMYLPDGMRIGDLCFKGLDLNGGVEIGYGLLPEFWGKGYATEAVIAMTDWALKESQVRYIEAETDPANAASQRVLQKVGFVPTGTMGEEGPRFRLDKAWIR